MRVLVCGSRKWNLWGVLATTLNEIAPSEIIHGGCPTGADALANKWADNNGLPCVQYEAEWDKYNRAAGPIRNQQMVDSKPDLVVAFGRGKGTDDCVRRAKKAGIPVRRVDA